MNFEFHYYATAFLALKAGFPLSEATTLAFSSQYVDHHLREWHVVHEGTTQVFRPTQSYAFWDVETTRTVLAPFHFFPAGNDAMVSVRQDRAVSRWDVRPHSDGAKHLLVAALRSGNLYRIGLALHTYSDTWAHQNFSALTERWNSLDDRSRWPVPGHAAVGWKPDLWGETWIDTRLVDSTISNAARFSACAGKVYRYLCTALGKDFRTDEVEVLAELRRRFDSVQKRPTPEERMVDFVLDFDLEPYQKDSWTRDVLVSQDPPLEAPAWWEQWKQAGQGLLEKAGWMPPLRWRTTELWKGSPLQHWLAAAETHRTVALEWISEHVGEP